MANRETAMSEDELERIIHLLRSTHLSIQEIARRTGYSRSVVASIKRRIERGKRRSGVWRNNPSVS